MFLLTFQLEIVVSFGDTWKHHELKCCFLLTQFTQHKLDSIWHAGCKLQLQVYFVRTSEHTKYKGWACSLYKLLCCVHICSDRHSVEQVETSHLSLQDAHWPHSNTQRLIPARVVRGRAPCETGTPATCSHQEKLFISALRGHFALLNHAHPDTLTLLWSIPHPVSGEKNYWRWCVT